MPELTAFLIAVGPLAIGVTKLVDFVRTFDKGDTWPSGLWIALAMVLGVALCLSTDLNFATLITGLPGSVSDALNGNLGEVVTGLAIGGSASGWHTWMAARSSNMN